MRDEVIRGMDELALEPVWWVKTFIPAETLETWPWAGFQLLAESLEKGAWSLGWGGQVDRWELKRAEHSLIMDGWVVVFRVWPPNVSA